MGFNAVKWVSANQAALNGVAVGLVVLGILLQAIAAPDEEAKEKAVEEEPRASRATHPGPRSSRQGQSETVVAKVTRPAQRPDHFPARWPVAAADGVVGEAKRFHLAVVIEIAAVE